MRERERERALEWWEYHTTITSETYVLGSVAECNGAVNENVNSETEKRLPDGPIES